MLFYFICSIFFIAQLIIGKANETEKKQNIYYNHINRHIYRYRKIMSKRKWITMKWKLGFMEQ